jgi:hypothetical protein
MVVFESVPQHVECVVSMTSFELVFVNPEPDWQKMVEEAASQLPVGFAECGHSLQGATAAPVTFKGYGILVIHRSHGSPLTCWALMQRWTRLAAAGLAVMMRRCSHFPFFFA